MPNAVALAKQDDDKNSCELSDVEYWSDYTVMYDVDDDGEPVSRVDDTDGDFRCYYCNNCEQEFETFEEVKEHLHG